ncbi:MAG: STAS domain-containing protein [Candidatus Rokubacteria bacterium]|nr:STAS domain-containing protein [Candidatus Rokubacteria bacterium]
MDIEVKDAGKITVVAPRGDVDMAVADEVRQRLTGLVDQGRARLVLDLASVMYIDSSGLGALVAAMKHARAAGGDIKVCMLESDVRALFEMTRLNKVLAVHTTRQEAVAAWG